MKNPSPTPYKRLILRAVLPDVSPIVARVFASSDEVEITDLHDVFLPGVVATLSEREGDRIEMW